MRPSNKSRSRNKTGNPGGNPGGNHNNRRSVGNIINRVFESAGPEGKVRGTPQQIIEKYQALARDAQVSNDRVAAESFQQHAEHYSRMLGEAQSQQLEQQRNSQERDEASRGGDDARGDRGETSHGDRNETPQGDGFQGEPERMHERPQAQRRPVEASSGLATFDTGERDEESGPVETPEGSRRHPPAREEIAREEMSRGPAREEMSRPTLMPAMPEDPRDRGSEHANGTAYAPQGDGEVSAGLAKRPRTRRKARSDADASEAQAK